MTPAQMAALHARVFSVPRPWSEAEFADFLASPLVFARVETSGFLLGRVVAGEAELLTLAVDPNHWGRGIGGRLVAAFIQTAQSQRCESAFLEVAARNERARALYARLGFLQVGCRRGYYSNATGPGDDALILVRPI